MRAFIKNNQPYFLLPSTLAVCLGLALAAPVQAAWSVADPYAVTTVCDTPGGNCSGYANGLVSANDNHDKFPKMNNVGDVVWQGRPTGAEDTAYDIYFKSAFSTVIERITDNLVLDSAPQLNDAGDITWMSFDGSSWLVNLFSGGSASTISAPTPLEPWPQINNLGDVAWLSVDGTDYEINLYQDGTVTQITNNESNDVQVRINDNGDLMWRGRGDLTADLSYDIYTWSSGVTTRVNNDDLLDWAPQINNNGDMVWLSYDGVQCDVMVKRAGDPDPVQITDTIDTEPAFEDHEPVINDEGIVAWQRFDGTDWEIMVYSGGVTTQLTDNDWDDVTPQINSLGDIAWFAFGGDIGIYLFDPSTGTVSKLSESYTGHYDSVPDINDQGKVVWSGYDGTDFEIIIAAPSGAIHDDVHFSPVLNLQSRGKRFTAVIDLPEPYSAADIDPATVAITMISPPNSLADPLPEPFYSTGQGRVGDADLNGVIDITITFDRQALIGLIQPLGVLGDYNLSVAGNLFDGSAFTGVDDIKVVDQKMSKVHKARPRFKKLENRDKRRKSDSSARRNSKAVDKRYADLGQKVAKAVKKQKK